jgi:hypothetical protein
MVKGLEVFRDYFAGQADQFVLIGGTAATLAVADAGLAFRATKDLDSFFISKHSRRTSRALQAKLVKGSTLKVYKGASPRPRRCAIPNIINATST